MSKQTNNTKERRGRFERLATYRTNEVLKKLTVLAHCANRSAYEYTEADIKAIFCEIEKAVRESRGKFHYPRKKIFKL